MTTFLFLRITHGLLELPRVAVTRGEPRIRPFVPTPVPVPPTCVSLPDRDTEPTATPRCEPGLPRAHASSVPIDVHGSPDRVKDVSSFVRALIRRPHDECVRNVSPHADHVPLLILPEGTCCRRCDRLHGNEPQVHAIRTDQDPRCSANPRRLTASRESGCLPPLRSRDESRDRPPAHAAHTFSPWLGTMCFGWALQAQRHVNMSPPRRSLRCDYERAGRLYDLVGGRSSPCPGGHAPGTDDPSAPTGLGLRGL
jgi:hypothetical protein